MTECRTHYAKESLFSLVLVATVAAGAGEFDRRLDQDRKAIHALNRLTFGPRPGDVEWVKQTGVDRWIEQQLNPESIPEDPALARNLRPLNALEITPSEAVRNYPPPQFIKAVAWCKAEPPSDPELAVVIERLAERYEATKTKTGGCEILYTTRACQGRYRPKVFRQGGVYTIHVSDPGTGRERELPGVQSYAQPDAATLAVRFDQALR